MQRLFISSILFFLGIIPLSAQDTIAESKPDTLIQITVDKMPQYGSGLMDYFKYLNDSLKYPMEAIENRIEGVVNIQFKVEKDGSLSNLKVTKSVHPLLDQEAIRLISSMPAWNPATRNGKPIAAYIELPIRFSVPGVLKRRALRKEHRENRRERRK